MPKVQASVPSPTLASGGKIYPAALIIVLAGLAAYGNSIHGVFLLDDRASIVENSTIQHGWLGALNTPTGGETTAGRPLVNLSLALNYRAGGLSVGGYHAFNLAVHLLAGLALFGLVRRTLELPKLRERFGAQAFSVALVAALLWTLHPLQTESVTYIVQRAESLMGLFYLLTLYCLARGLGQARSGVWLGFSIAACVLGVFCKEVIATAPLMALLYDRTFVAGTFAAALRQRRKFYAALAATWLPLGWLAWQAGNRAGSAGFGSGASPWNYALTQAGALADYLRLSVWPQSLSLDYGMDLAKDASDVAPQIALVLVLLAGTVYLLWRKPALGFLGAWFFVVLAPSSSIVPVITETEAEHRLYLPLAALAAGAAVGLHAWLGRRALVATLALAVALGAMTFARNQDYSSAMKIWRDDTAKHPNLARAHENLAVTLDEEKRLPESLQEFHRALQLRPVFPECEIALGKTFAAMGSLDDAASCFARAAQEFSRPREQAIAYFDLGNALGESGRFDDALAAYTQSVQLLPENAAAHNLRGYVLSKMGRYAEAITEYQQALKLQPDFPQCAANLAAARKHLEPLNS